MTPLVAISRELSDQVDALRFPSVPFVYNPLVVRTCAPRGIPRALGVEDAA